jgi:hypothetical protein
MSTEVEERASISFPALALAVIVLIATLLIAALLATARSFSPAPPRHALTLPHRCPRHRPE